MTGAIYDREPAVIQSQSNVEKAVRNEALSGGNEIAIDLILKNKRSIFSDLPRIAEQAGLNREAVSYHYALLNMYLIRSGEDAFLAWKAPAPRR